MKFRHLHLQLLFSIFIVFDALSMRQLHLVIKVLEIYSERFLHFPYINLAQLCRYLTHLIL